MPFSFLRKRNPSFVPAKIVCFRIVPASSVKEQEIYEQLDLFTDYAALRKEQEEEKRILEREQKMQKAMLEIKKKYGKNAI